MAPMHSRVPLALAGLVGGLLLTALVGCVPGLPYDQGYVVDLSGTLVLRTVVCEGGKPLLFERADVYPESALRDNGTFTGDPVWSATSRHGVGLVILGADQQPGLTIVSNQPIRQSSRYLVSYTYTDGLSNMPLDLRPADLADGIASSALGITSERDLLRHNPKAFGGCPYGHR